MKRKYGGGQSKGSAKISWARHELQGRTAMVVVEGPDGAPAETTHPDGCERAPLVETTPNPALQPLLRGHGKVRHPSRLWRRWARANLRGQGQSLSPTAPQHLKLPVTCCHRPAHRHFPQTRPDCSCLQRDAGQVGKKGREKSLCVAKARHAGSEPAWARSQPGAENLCPAIFSSQVPGRKKTGGRKGRDRSLKRKRCACAESRDWCSRSENNQNQRARHPHGISPGRKHTRCDRHRRAGETCTSRSNGAALERRFALLETYVIWSADSGSERDRNCCDAGARWRRISRADQGRWVLLRGVSTASRLPDQCRRSRRRWRRKNLRSLWRNDRLYSQMPRPFRREFGGYRRHRFVQLRCRPIGSFFYTCTNQ